MNIQVASALEQMSTNLTRLQRLLLHRRRGKCKLQPQVVNCNSARYSDRYVSNWLAELSASSTGHVTTA
eukprot:2901305-Amphidinium_carterae.1